MQLAELLRLGNVGVIRTDTLYGVVDRADNQAAVERIYELKHRDEHKPMIVLIGDKVQMFDQPSNNEKALLNEVWPGKTSVILPAPSAPDWLTRGRNTIAYRLPDNQELQALFQKTGPLIAPSANPEGEPTAVSTGEAIDYFGETIDFYVDGGEVYDTRPSTLLRFQADGSVKKLR